MTGGRDHSDQKSPTKRRRRGRRKNRKSWPLDISGRFNRPLDYKANGVEQRGSPVEIGLLSQVAKAIGKGHMPSARAFLRSCELCGLIEIPTFDDGHQYVLRIPKGWDDDEWMEMYDRFGPPPWKGERDGLVRDAEGYPVYD
jgi:hypothetical protein